MSLFKLLLTFLVLQSLCQVLTRAALFREYIGAQFKNVRFSDVPINPKIEVHFILSFAIDYTTASSATPTNGAFNVFWDTNNLSPSHVSEIKKQHSNVKVALSIGGASVGKENVYFTPSSIDSWVSNAVSSLTRIIKQYHLDGIDIDYEQYKADPDTFTQCIGKLITILKQRKVISFASIAPYDDREVQSHYMALWRSYGHVIDFVNFQFYAYDQGTTVSQFLSYFNTQASNYKGGKVLVSMISDGSGGLSPKNGFFTACDRLKSQKKLDGIFIWCADDSKANKFLYERQSQAMLVQK